MSQILDLESKSCKAILEQGSHKATQCDRPKLENGYCGKHQKQAEIDKALEEGQRKCSKYRCTITFIPKTSKSIEYCDECAKNKTEKLKDLKLCEWSELKCNNKAQESGFCGKHEARGLLLKEANEKGIRYCDDGKRACKNTTLDGKLRCEDCLAKDRVVDTKRYEQRKESLNICLGCGTTLSSLLEGITGKKVQRCVDCYTKLRNTEEARGPRERNYLAEKKANIDKYLINYISGAKDRNLSFDLTKEKFEELVTSPCFYCSSYNENEVIGIDRINSLKNYTVDNCVSCCKTCNYMKGTMTRRSFILQAHKIATQFPIEELSDSEEESDNDSNVLSSTISPMKVAELYRNGKLKLFIDACIRDARSPLFIERLKGVETTKMGYREFVYFFRQCCKTDSKLAVAHASNQRQRISYKEIYGYFNNKNSKYAIDIYQNAHGVMSGFKEDMETIAEKWDTLSFDERTSAIYSVMVKYQNKRAYGSVEFKSQSASTDDQNILVTHPVEVTKGRSSLIYSIPSTIELNNYANPPHKLPGLPLSTEEENHTCFANDGSSISHPTVVTKQEAIHSTELPKKEPIQSQEAPAQWKISNIYRALVTTNTKAYLSYLQENNPQADLEAKLATLTKSIKPLTKEAAELQIKTFIEDLRTARHNAHCYSKNDALLLREDREHWNSQSVLRAFNANMLDKFKEHTEANTGESATDPIWSKRWTAFVESVSNETDLTKKSLISKFLTAQRTKKYRKSSKT